MLLLPIVHYFGWFFLCTFVFTFSKHILWMYPRKIIWLHLSNVNTLTLTIGIMSGNRKNVIDNDCVHITSKDYTWLEQVFEIIFSINYIFVRPLILYCSRFFTQFVIICSASREKLFLKIELDGRGKLVIGRILHYLYMARGISHPQCKNKATRCLNIN